MYMDESIWDVDTSKVLTQNKTADDWQNLQGEKNRSTITAYQNALDDMSQFFISL